MSGVRANSLTGNDGMRQRIRLRNRPRSASTSTKISANWTCIRSPAASTSRASPPRSRACGHRKTSTTDREPRPKGLLPHRFRIPQAGERTPEVPRPQECRSAPVHDDVLRTDEVRDAVTKDRERSAWGLICMIFSVWRCKASEMLSAWPVPPSPRAFAVHDKSHRSSFVPGRNRQDALHCQPGDRSRDARQTCGRRRHRPAVAGHPQPLLPRSGTIPDDPEPLSVGGKRHRRGSLRRHARRPESAVPDVSGWCLRASRQTTLPAF